MKYPTITTIIICASILIAVSCNSTADKTKENNNGPNGINTSENGTAPDTSGLTGILDSAQGTLEKLDTSLTSQQKNGMDNMFSQIKSMSSFFGKSGINGQENPFSNSLDSMMAGKKMNPGDAIARTILNLQLGQMNDNNPLKQVANEMLKAQKNGTAGPYKTYTAMYVAEQPVNYAVPVSGKGNVIQLSYTGGSIINNEKDGLWKNVYLDTQNQTAWNVYTESYAESSALDMKVHSTALANKNSDYTINLNDQFKKYNKQSRKEQGKNDFNVTVKKIGNEKMFGYNCVHVQITYTVSALHQTDHEQDDEWYSTEVPGAQFLSPVIFENHSPATVKKMMDLDCAGALVKLASHSKEANHWVQLTHIERKDLPVAFFTLPTNYQQDKNTILYGMQ